MVARAAFLSGLLLVAAMPLAAQAPEGDLVAQDGVVRLADIALLRGTPEAMGERVVARIPAGRDRLELDSAAVERMLRRAAPALALEPKFAGPVSFLRAAKPQASTPCKALTSELRAGDYLEADMLRDAACDGADQAARNALDYDRCSRSLRALRSLPAGTNLGPIAAPEGSVIAAGAPMVLRVQSGPVMIERTVRTLQPARAGSAVFVETEDGSILSAPVGDTQ